MTLIQSVYSLWEYTLSVALTDNQIQTLKKKGLSMNLQKTVKGKNVYSFFSETEEANKYATKLKMRRIL